MQFEYPRLLWVLAFWPVLALLGWRALAWRARVAGRLGAPELLGRLYPESVRRWRRRRLGLLLLATALMMIAAARPQYGQIEQKFESVGTNVIIAIDVSASMGARDVEPSRMARAKESLLTLLRELVGQRIGIVAFAGRAFLQCPMTLDLKMAQLVLDAVEINSVGTPGTDVGAAIRTAVTAFDRDASRGGRALVLLTDGEDLEGHGIEAAREAAAAGIVIHAIGIGSPEGAPLVEEEGGFKKGPGGQTVTTRVDMAGLEAIAAATGGMAIHGGEAPELAVAQVAQAIGRQEKAQLESRRQVINQDRFQWFVLPALLIVLLAVSLRPEPTRLGRLERADGMAPAPEIPHERLARGTPGDSMQARL